jgi:phosphate starvation-inducible PhoH-like protein
VYARTPNQYKLVDAVAEHDMVFAVGPAGTGKTYTAVALAVKALKEKRVKKIILTRPAVEAGENLGFLPGDMKEKLDPYLQPLYDALTDMIPPEKVAEFLDKGVIEVWGGMQSTSSQVTKPKWTSPTDRSQALFMF